MDFANTSETDKMERKIEIKREKIHTFGVMVKERERGNMNECYLKRI